MRNYKNDLLIGYFIAVVPGFIIHGAGNMYAEDWSRGLVLFGVEIASLTGILFAAGDRWEADDRGEKVGIETNILEGVSIALFFISWIWDIATVGGDIKDKYPERIRLSIGSMRNNR